MGKSKTFAECLEAARPWKSISEWIRNSKTTYSYAYTKNWHRKIQKKLGWELLCISHKYKDCLKAASIFSSLNEWATKDNNSYLAAVRKHWHRKIQRALKWDARDYTHRTYKDCLEAARPFNNPNDWQMYDSRSYQSACYHGWREKIKKDLKWKPRSGTAPTKEALERYIKDVPNANQTDIGEHFKMCGRSISRLIKKWDIMSYIPKTKNYNTKKASDSLLKKLPTKIRVVEVERLHRKGISVTAIAKNLKIDERMVNEILHKSKK